jgi:hypothetical protein
MEDTSNDIQRTGINPDEKNLKRSKLDHEGESGIKPTPGIEMTMLKCVQHIPPIIIQTPEVSTFVPNSAMLYYVLHEMDLSLLGNRQWSSKLPRWTPLHDRVYYGILFYIQTLRCMKEAGKISTDLRQFLFSFEQNYPLESLVIAGPLIPFFKALTVCSPPYPEYGLVTPVIPNSPGAVVNNHQSLPSAVKVLLPNLVGLFRGVANMRRPLLANNVPINWNHNLANPTGNAVAIAHTAPNQQSRDCLVTPGTMTDIGFNNRQKVAYQGETSIVRFPSVPANAVLNDWPSYFGLSDDPSWFSELIGQMIAHASFFKGTSTLGNMSPRNGNTGLVQNCLEYTQINWSKWESVLS